MTPPIEQTETEREQATRLLAAIHERIARLCEPGGLLDQAAVAATAPSRDHSLTDVRSPNRPGPTDPIGPEGRTFIAVLAEIIDAEDTLNYRLRGARINPARPTSLRAARLAFANIERLASTPLGAQRRDLRSRWTSLVLVRLADDLRRWIGALSRLRAIDAATQIRTVGVTCYYCGAPTLTLRNRDLTCAACGAVYEPDAWPDLAAAQAHNSRQGNAA